MYLGVDEQQRRIVREPGDIDLGFVNTARLPVAPVQPDIRRGCRRQGIRQYRVLGHLHRLIALRVDGPLHHDARIRRTPAEMPHLRHRRGRRARQPRRGAADAVADSRG